MTPILRFLPTALPAAGKRSGCNGCHSHTYRGLSLLQQLPAAVTCPPRRVTGSSVLARATAADGMRSSEEGRTLHLCMKDWRLQVRHRSGILSFATTARVVLLRNMPKSSAHRSLLDWNDDDPEAHKITSPRSVRAMKAAGVISIDLMMKALEDFEEPGVLPDIVKIRFDHFKARRQEILRDVMRHYQATGEAPVAKENSAGDSSALAIQQSEGAEKLRQVLEQEQRATEMLKNRQKQVRNGILAWRCIYIFYIYFTQ